MDRYEDRQEEIGGNKSTLGDILMKRTKEKGEWENVSAFGFKTQTEKELEERRSEQDTKETKVDEIKRKNMGQTNRSLKKAKGVKRDEQG